MDDLEHALVDAWYKHRARILSDPAELQRRLARRRSGVMLRPPRAWCLAVRASDTRVDPFAFACVPEDAAYPARYRADRSTAYYAKHTVVLTAEGLRKICRPVRITPPGQTMQEVGDLLGCHPENLRWAMCRGIFRVHYVPHLGGRRGKPVPLIYSDRLFDPSAGKIGIRPDAIWGTLWQGLADLLPDSFEQTLTRVPSYRKRGPVALDPDRPGWVRRSNKLPPPPLDWVWYKWKDGKPIPEMQRGRRKSAGTKAQRHEGTEGERPNASARVFRGWNWVCPACKREVRAVYYPLPPFNLLQYLNEKIPVHEADELQTPPPTFACYECHNIRYFASIDGFSWNHLVSHLSGGLPYGHEVAKPESFVRARRGEFRPRIGRAPSRRRQQVMELLVAGRTYQQIAEELGIGIATVGGYVMGVYRQHKVHLRGKLCERLKAPIPLPPRRQQVFQRLLRGYTYKGIAADMHCTFFAVGHHVRRIYRHYHVHSRAELIALPEFGRGDLKVTAARTLITMRRLTSQIP